MKRKQLFRARFWAAGLVLALLPASGVPAASQSELQSQSLKESVLHALDKAVCFFRTLSIRGGYVHFYDLKSGRRWGEGQTDDQTIEVQPPGTPSVGMAFLRAFKATGNRDYLKAAEEAAEALISGQNELGGWEHTIRFDRPKGRRVSFDDNQTQSAIRFLIALDQESHHTSLEDSIEKALHLMLESQFENGAWPHQYPKQGNYHDFATFNDGGINDCISVMMDAYSCYGRPEYLDSLRLAGDFLLLSQLPPPQPGWAQQYNQYLQPAWARSFEPPSVCPLVTLRNVNTLLDLALFIRDMRYLEPISDALTWVREVRLPSGLWPRFVELGTDRPLYYDRGRKRVNSFADLKIERRTGYRYEQDLSEALAQGTKRYDSVKRTLSEGSPGVESNPRPDPVAESLIRKIISEQDKDGRWVSRNNRYRARAAGEVWSGEYAYSDRVSSRLFVSHVHALCEYLEQVRESRADSH